MCRRWQSGNARAWRRGKQGMRERANGLNMCIAAIVLAGGQSRRMGADKALLCLPSGGPTLVERVVAAAWTAGADEVFVVGDGTRLPTVNACVVPDMQQGAGPLAGLATGFAGTQCDVALALACDLPYLSVPLLRAMIAIARSGAEAEWDALVPFLPPADCENGTDGKAGWQPLHALYTRACLPPIHAALEAGERRMTAFFPHVRVRALTADVMSPYDPALRSTRSVNTPEAWAEAARWLATQEGDILPHRT